MQFCHMIDYINKAENFWKDMQIIFLKRIELSYIKDKSHMIK